MSVEIRPAAVHDLRDALACDRSASDDRRAFLHAAMASVGGNDVWTSTNHSNGPMRALLAAEDWEYCGELVGLDEGDPELFFETGDHS